MGKRGDCLLPAPDRVMIRGSENRPLADRASTQGLLVPVATRTRIPHVERSTWSRCLLSRIPPAQILLAASAWRAVVQTCMREQSSSRRIQFVTVILYVLCGQRGAKFEEQVVELENLRQEKGGVRQGWS